MYLFVCGDVPSDTDVWAIYMSPDPCPKSICVNQHSSNQQQINQKKEDWLEVAELEHSAKVPLAAWHN